MRRTLTILSLTLSLCAGCASQPGGAPSEAKAPVPPPAAELARSGLAVVAEADVTLRAAPGGRDIPIHVTYPNGPGPFPVIVFSHGAGGTGSSYRPLARFWATHGYVVLAPTHAGRADPKALDALRETAADAGGDAKAWEARARELSRVIASLDEIGGQVPALAGKLDGSRVGVAGHAYGAFAAKLLAGAAVVVKKGQPALRFGDPAPRAFLLLSPPGKGQQGLTETSWQGLDRPTMVVTGTRDRGIRGQEAAWRLDAFRHSPPGDKYAVVLEGGGHLSTTGRAAEPGAALPRGRGKDAVTVDQEVATFKLVKIATVAFWDAYLEGDARAKAFLESDALETESGGKAKLTRR